MQNRPNEPELFTPIKGNRYVLVTGKVIPRGDRTMSQYLSLGVTYREVYVIHDTGHPTSKKITPTAILGASYIDKRRKAREEELKREREESKLVDLPLAKKAKVSSPNQDKQPENPKTQMDSIKSDQDVNAGEESSFYFYSNATEKKKEESHAIPENANHDETAIDLGLQATRQADFSDEQAQAAYNKLMEEIDLLPKKTSSENNNSVDEDEQITNQSRNSNRGSYGLFPSSPRVDDSITEQEVPKTQKDDNLNNKF